MHQDLAGFGATPEQLERYGRQPAKPQPFEVLPANWLAVMVFNDCAGQWLRNDAGTPEGIARPALESTMRLWPVPARERSDTFHRIRVMEAAALQEYRNRATRRKR